MSSQLFVCRGIDSAYCVKTAETTSPELSQIPLYVVKNKFQLYIFFLIWSFDLDKHYLELGQKYSPSKKMFNQDEGKIEYAVGNRRYVFVRARKPRLVLFYFCRLDSRYLFVSDSWNCLIQTTRLIMFFRIKPATFFTILRWL